MGRTSIEEVRPGLNPFVVRSRSRTYPLVRPQNDGTFAALYRNLPRTAREGASNTLQYDATMSSFLPGFKPLEPYRNLLPFLPCGEVSVPDTVHLAPSRSELQQHNYARNSPHDKSREEHAEDLHQNEWLPGVTRFRCPRRFRDGLRGDCCVTRCFPSYVARRRRSVRRANNGRWKTAVRQVPGTHAEYERVLIPRGMPDRRSWVTRLTKGLPLPEHEASCLAGAVRAGPAACVVVWRIPKKPGECDEVASADPGGLDAALGSDPGAS